jgi:hypothetical protein
MVITPFPSGKVIGKFTLPTGKRYMEIDDIIVFEDLVETGHLMVDKDMEKKVRPVFRGPDGRKPEQQVINGCPGFKLHDYVVFVIKPGDKGLRMTDSKT